MEKSERFGFNLPSRDGDDLADINQISDNFRIIENVVPYVDGKFDPKSQNAQNGEAVSEAVKMVGNPILKYLTYEVKENNTVNIVSCDKTIYGKHIIPEFIDGYPVTSIGANFSPGMAWAFYGCENLTEIVIPDSVEVVGANAFSACINLNGVMFGRGVKTIKASAFSECSSLNFVKMHNVIETIEIGAFEECGALSDVYYSGSAEEWGNISVGRSNDYLLQATIHFNYDSTPTTKGYVDEALRNAVDQTYSPESTNAQSGKAIAEALNDLTEWQTIVDITLDETNGDVNSLNVQIPKETVDIVKQCIELMCFVGFTAKNDYSASKVYLRCYLVGLNLPVLYATNNTLAKDKQARTLSRTLLSDVGNLSFTAPLTQYELFNSSTVLNNYTCQTFNNIKDRNETVFFNANLSFSSTQTEKQTFGAGTHFKLIGRKA